MISVVIFNIFKHLSCRDLYQCIQVCKKFYRIFKSSPLWEYKLTQKNIPGNSIIHYKDYKDQQILNKLFGSREIYHVSKQFEAIKYLPNLTGFTKIRTLVLNYNLLKRLPDLNELKTLRYLSASHNELEEFPKIADLPNLQEVNLSNNKITVITEIPDCLLKLYISNNLITTLPDLKNLQYLHIKSNTISELPETTTVIKI